MSFHCGFFQIVTILKEDILRLSSYKRGWVRNTFPWSTFTSLLFHLLVFLLTTIKIKFICHFDLFNASRSHFWETFLCKEAAFWSFQRMLLSSLLVEQCSLNFAFYSITFAVCCKLILDQSYCPYWLTIAILPLSCGQLWPAASRRAVKGQNNKVTRSSTETFK